MRNNTTAPRITFANPQPVKKEENPGVLLTVNGKLVLADHFIYTQQVSAYMALNWVQELLNENHKLENSIKNALDALPVSVLREYTQETDMGDDDSNDDDNKGN